MVYYLPQEVSDQLEDTIAATLCLRHDGTRVHITHSLQALAKTVEDYDSGELPPEQLVTVSDAAMVRARAQSSHVEHGLKDFVAALKTKSETGEYPDGFIERIRGGHKRNEALRRREAQRKHQSLKPWWRRLFEKPSPIPSVVTASQEGITAKKLPIYAILQPCMPNGAPDPSRLRPAGYVTPPDGRSPNSSYGLALVKGSDPLVVLEGNCAIYWHRELESRSVSRQKAQQWLEHTEAVTSNSYNQINASPESRAVHDSLLCGLTRANIHYALTIAKDSVFPNSFARWYDHVVSQGEKAARFFQIQESNRLRDALSAGLLSPEFVEHLKKGAGEVV